jgi:mono/diheme cytochrome c family protein
MKNHSAWLNLNVIAGLCAALAAATAVAADHPAGKSASSQVKRGEQLVATHGCHDCHTPLKMGRNGPEPDMSQMLAGHPQGLKMPAAPKLDMPWMWAGSATNTAFAGPWGISYAINLTPDAESGIGKWKVDEFVKALKTGRHLGVGRPIMPPMPWQGYGRLSDAELRAMFAYLQSVPAIRNKAPDYAPPVASASVPGTAAGPGGGK